MFVASQGSVGATNWPEYFLCPIMLQEIYVVACLFRLQSNQTNKQKTNNKCVLDFISLISKGIKPKVKLFGNKFTGFC